MAGRRATGPDGVAHGVLVGEAAVVGGVPLEDHVDEGTDHEHDHCAEQDRQPEGEEGIHGVGFLQEITKGTEVQAS